MSGTKVDLDTLRAAIKEYEDIYAELEAAWHSGEVLATIVGAGRDAPSQVYANWARNTGIMHRQSNEQLRNTLKTRIENLTATLEQYEQTEQGNKDNLK